MVPSLAAGAGAGVPLFPGTRKNGVRAERSPDCSTGFALRGMVPSPTPKRDHGDPQAFGSEARAKEDLVRAVGIEPTLSLRKNGFSYPSTAFAAPGCSAKVRVWTIPSPLPDVLPGFQV